MPKKTVAALLALCLLCLCALPAAAKNENVISVKINSDIAGLSEVDVEKLFEIKSDNMIYCTKPSGPIHIADYAGTAVMGKLKAGRTYYLYYTMEPAEGFTMPEKLTDENLEIECEKGARVISAQIVTFAYRIDENTIDHDSKGVMIYAAVVVDSNPFQRFFGIIYDVILKIRAWSLYE